MPTIFLAWELGAGLGHVATLRQLAQRLMLHRIRVVAAVKDVRAAQPLAELGVDVIQAPVWPFLLAGDERRGKISSATMCDMLAGFGLADEVALRMLLTAWDRLLALVRPDVVVADYAPAVTLAARGRLPVIVLGNGFTLPPHEMATFPLLHSASPPVQQEARVLETVNRTLAAIATPPLERLPQIFSGDVRLLLTFALLDPYHAHRTEAADGPIMQGVPQLREQGADIIFAYLRQHPQLRPAALEALFPFASRLRAFGSAISPQQAAVLARFGAKIENSPPPLASALASAQLFVHHGGAGVAAEAIVAGVPQLVFSVDIEKDLIGEAVERAGIGRHVKIHDPAADASSQLIESIMKDNVIATRAAEVGEHHRKLLLVRDPLGKFEKACLEFVS